MIKKLNNYNSNFLFRIALGVKGFTTSLSVSAILMNQKWISISILVIGALANEMVNYYDNKFKTQKNENTTN